MNKLNIICTNISNDAQSSLQQINKKEVKGKKKENTTHTEHN